jgi:hypothetical protein
MILRPTARRTRGMEYGDDPKVAPAREWSDAVIIVIGLCAVIGSVAFLSFAIRLLASAISKPDCRRVEMREVETMSQGYGPTGRSKQQYKVCVD